MTDRKKSNPLLARCLVESTFISLLFFGFCVLHYFAYQNYGEQTVLNLADDRVEMISALITSGQYHLDEPSEYSFELAQDNGAHGYFIFRQKGGSAMAELFDTPTAMLNFAKSLEPGVIEHTIVKNPEGIFYVSGTDVDINGQNYHLLYYMEQSGIQDINGFFKSRGMWILSAAVFAFMFVFVCCYMAFKADKARAALERVEEENRVLTSRMENMKKKEEDLPTVRKGIWEEEMLHVFLKQIQERRISPCTLAVVQFESLNQRRKSIHEMALHFNPYILRFLNEDKTMTLLFLKYDEKQARAILDQMKHGFKKILEVRRVDHENHS